MKTAVESGEALMCYLGRKSDRSKLEYGKFKECLDKLVVDHNDRSM